MMIKLNLLDENEIAKNRQSAGSMGMKNVTGGTAIPRELLIGLISGGVIYLCFLGYYFFGVGRPLKEMRNEFRDYEQKLALLNPKVAETEKLSGELDKIRVFTDEFQRFMDTKRNWARILNILSDELPEEIIFENLSVNSTNFSKKTKTDKGLVTVNIPCSLLKIDLLVPEEFQNKISAYEKKLKNDSWINSQLISIENTGLALREKSYTSSLMLYFGQKTEEVSSNG